VGLYIRESVKPVAQAVADLEQSVKRHGFGLLHSYDFRKTLREKGYALDSECHVLEVCNPKQASEALQNDMTVNMALPCRISVWQESGRTKIGMIAPSALLALVSNSPAMAVQAAKIEATVRQMIDEAA
jgi:uncharacterized protein (DUF302 family)